ncbi:hypothetical protein BC332_07169 [Capsicum chinense]|nr:hypothetical protein BC332_07169 [Capsicum chinense]
MTHGYKPYAGVQVVSCLLERLRGAANATEPRTQRAIYEMGCSVLNPLLMSMEVYKHEMTSAGDGDWPHLDKSSKSTAK